jgi:hypothetical protein
MVILLLGMHGEAVHLAIGYDRELQNLHGSDLIMWQCVEFLKSKGYVLFNMLGLVKGDSPRAEGIRNYKLTWAGENGCRLSSYALSRGICGLSPALISRQIRFAQKCVHIIRKFSAGRKDPS